MSTVYDVIWEVSDTVQLGILNLTLISRRNEMKRFWKTCGLVLILFALPAAYGGQEQTADDMIETLISELKNPDPIVRFAAVLGLSGVEEHKAVASAALVEMLSDEDAGVRAASLMSLGKVGIEDNATIAAMEAMLKDENEEVRAAAADALAGPPMEYKRPVEKQTAEADEPNLDNWEPGEPKTRVDADPTGFIIPLTDHHNNLYAIHQRITELRNAPKPKNNEGFIKRAKDWKNIGQTGVAEGEAFARKLHALINAETRSGTAGEIRLAQGNVRTFAVIVRDYQLLVGAKGEQDRIKLKELLLKEAKLFALERLKQKIAERFTSKGLREVLNSKSWKEVNDTTVSVLISKASQRLDRITQDAVGLGFHDLNSLRVALRQRVDRVVRQHIEELLINLSGKGLIVRLVGRQIITWLADEFWSKVKKELHEAFREKGSHELRVNRSIATLRSAQKRLHALPAKARLNEVDAALNNAQWTINATRYLVRDLGGAIRKHARGVLTKEELAKILNKKPSNEVRMKLQRGEASPEFLTDMLLDDLSEARQDVLRKRLSDSQRFAFIDELSYLVQLNGWIDDVVGAAGFTTRVRFMADNRERLLKLSQEEELLKALVAYLKKLVAAVEIPGEVKKTGKDKQLYLRFYEVLGPDGPVPADIPRPGIKPHKPGNVWPSFLRIEFYYLDPDLVAELRQHWRNEGRDDYLELPLERLPIPRGSEPHHGRYSKTYLARITANGQTLYMQRAEGLNEYGGPEGRTWATGRILGLTEGQHQVEVSAVTEEGLRYDSTITIAVDAVEPRKQQTVDDYKKKISDFRERQAKDKAAGRNGPPLENLSGYLLGYSLYLMQAGQGTPEEILSMLAEAQQVSGQVRTMKIEEARKRKRPESSAYLSYERDMFKIVELCGYLGGEEAYARAKDAAAAGQAAFTTHAAALRKEGTKGPYDQDKRRFTFCHLHLANLAISAGNSGTVAVKHLEDWMKARRELGDEIDEEYEKKQRASWPQDVQF